MKENDTLIRIDPIEEEEEDFSKTRPISLKAVVEDISVSHAAYLHIRCEGKDSVGVQLDHRASTIGRSSRCRIQINLPDVSRMHAKITFQNEEFQIEDFDSTNGTFVNGVQIKKCMLRNNDQIQIGAARILFIEENLRK